MDGGDHENDSRFEVHELDDEDDNGKEEDGEDGDWETDVDEGLEMEDYVSEFTAHKEPVYCLDLYKDTGVVVTGSQDERAFVWDSKSDTQLAMIEGHNDTIVSVAFHPQEPYLATADMLGVIQVFSTESDSKERLWSYECGMDLNLVFWHPVAKVVFAGLGNGDLFMLKVGTEELKCYSGAGFEVSAAKITENGLDVIVGYHDSSVKCWNLKSCSVISSTKLTQDIDMPVSKIELHKEQQYLACTTEAVCLVNIKTGKILAKYGHFSADTEMNQTPESAMPEVETFALCPSNPNLLCLGRNTGRIETWDITAKCIRNVEQLRGAIIKMLFPRMSKEPMCLATTSAGIVFCFDALTGTVLRSFRGHEGPVFDIALASDDSFFVTCGEDSTVKVFSLS